ncbi:MAG: hypothetical protein RL161_686 [Bacteroidota bacterium]
MIVYKSPSAAVSLIPEHSCINFKWTLAATNLLEEELKSEVLKILPYIEENKSVSLILDERDFSLHSNFDLTDWFEFEFIPQVSSAGISRIAVVVSVLRIAEFKDQQIQSFHEPVISFFSDPDDAADWIMQP